MNKELLNKFNELAKKYNDLGNEKALFAVKIIKQYAEENGTLPRSTNDLSPMEEWLIIQLLIKNKENENNNR